MKRYAVFGAFALMLVAALKFAGWLPYMFERENLRAYPDLDSAVRALGPGGELSTPYFPQDLEWPPFEVDAGVHPHKILLAHFRLKKNLETAMFLSRRAEAARYVPSRIEPEKILAVEKAEVKGRRAALSIALCKDRRPCNKLEWKDAGMIYTVIFRGSAEELLKISESLARESAPPKSL